MIAAVALNYATHQRFAYFWSLDAGGGETFACGCRKVLTSRGLRCGAISSVARGRMSRSVLQHHPLNPALRRLLKPIDEVEVDVESARAWRQFLWDLNAGRRPAERRASALYFFAVEATLRRQ